MFLPEMADLSYFMRFHPMNRMLCESSKPEVSKDIIVPDHTLVLLNGWLEDDNAQSILQ